MGKEVVDCDNRIVDASRGATIALDRFLAEFSFLNRKLSAKPLASREENVGSMICTQNARPRAGIMMIVQKIFARKRWNEGNNR